MTDKNLKKRLNQEDTVGFGDFVDEFEDEINESLPKGPLKKDAVSNINNQIVRDHDRLVKSKKFLTMKLPFLRKYPQSEAIIEKLELEHAYLHKHVLIALKKTDSNFLKNMDFIWKKTFRLD